MYHKVTVMSDARQGKGHCECQYRTFHCRFSHSTILSRVLVFTLRLHKVFRSMFSMYQSV